MKDILTILKESTDNSHLTAALTHDDLDDKFTLVVYGNGFHVVGSHTWDLSDLDYILDEVVPVLKSTNLTTFYDGYYGQ